MAEYYLPKGTWTNLLTGEVKEGGRWVNEKHDYLSIPPPKRGVGRSNRLGDVEKLQIQYLEFAAFSFLIILITLLNL